MVIHILKDGTILNDIRGYVVKKEDVPMAYELIDRMNHERRNKIKYEGDKKRSSLNS